MTDLNEDAGEMVELHGSGTEADLMEATILLYSPQVRTHLQKMTGLADMMSYIYSEHTKGRTEAKARTSGDQKMREDILMRRP